VTLSVLADNWFLVVTSNVMPFDSVSVEIVEDGHASLFLAALLDLFTVVGLTTGWVESSGEGPVLESSSIARIKPGLIGRPEPAVDVLGEKVGTVTAVKVAKTA